MLGQGEGALNPAVPVDDRGRDGRPFVQHALNGRTGRVYEGVGRDHDTGDDQHGEGESVVQPEHRVVGPGGHSLGLGLDVGVDLFEHSHHHLGWIFNGLRPANLI